MGWQYFKYNISLVIVFVASFAIAGCAVQPLKEDLREGSRIGVLSLLRPSLIYQDLGTTAFTCNCGSVPNPTLDINAEATSVLVAALQKDGVYLPVTVEKFASRLRMPYAPEGMRRMDYKFNLEKSQEDVQWLGKQTSIQYLLIISSSWSYNQYTRPQTLDNYGYYCSSMLGIKDAGVFGVFQLDLIDMARLETVASTHAQVVRRGDYLCQGRSYPDFSNDQKLYVDNELRTLVREMLPKALFDIGLLHTAPASRK